MEVYVDKLPKDCWNGCPYSWCKESHPFWCGENANTKVYCCTLDKNSTATRIDFDNDTFKREDCPIQSLDDFNQNAKAIEVLEKAKIRVQDFYHNDSKCLNKDDAIEDFVEVIDQLIKEYGGKNE